MLKKILSSALAVCMVLGAAAALPESGSVLDSTIVANAGGGYDENDVWEDCFFGYKNNNKVTICSFINDPNYELASTPSKYFKDGKLLVIPTKLKGMKVTGVSLPYLMDWSKGTSAAPEPIMSVYVPSTVTEIYGLGMDVIIDYDSDDMTETLVPIKGFTIYTPKGSAAEKYAKQNGFAVVNTDEYEKNDPAQKAGTSIAKAKITGLKSKYYTGKTIKQKPVVKLGKKTLKEGTDYTVSYKNNKKVGTATVTIKGKGNYAGTAKATFKICPKKTTLKKATSPKTKKLKVTYSKVKGVTGYQITYSTSKKFTKKTTKSVKAKGTSKTISKLKKGKTYYVKVRTYKTVKGKNYCSGYSKVKKVKVK